MFCCAAHRINSAQLPHQPHPRAHHFQVTFQFRHALPLWNTLFSGLFTFHYPSLVHQLSIKVADVMCRISLNNPTKPICKVPLRTAQLLLSTEFGNFPNAKKCNLCFPIPHACVHVGTAKQQTKPPLRRRMHHIPQSRAVKLFSRNSSN